jgi:hypothetical protein
MRRDASREICETGGLCSSRDYTGLFQYLHYVLLDFAWADSKGQADFMVQLPGGSPTHHLVFAIRQTKLNCFGRPDGSAVFTISFRVLHR